jgi:TonB family protein
MTHYVQRIFSGAVRRSIGASLLLGAIALLQITAAAQAAKLSLADLLIGLRSQKVALSDRNRILAAAVKERGVTFAYTPEIERELSTTGANAELLAAIKEVSTPKPEPTPAATPVPTPTPPDWSFYAKRADASAAKGELSVALADYDKAAELGSDQMSVFVGRARAHFGLQAFDKAINDYDRVVALAPKDAGAYYYRGLTYERAGNVEKALADYRMASQLDAKHESAKASVKRIEDDLAKAAEAAKPKPAPVVQVRPEFLQVGTLTSADAERMVMPIYPQIAYKAAIEGRVSVEIELDEEGKVVSAKAGAGHQMLRQAAEDAARRSRFKPATFEGVPIKAKGVLVYNFSVRGEE